MSYQLTPIIIKGDYRRLFIAAFLLFFCSTSVNVFAQQVHFTHDFAPTGELVPPQEKPFRSSICLNGEWQFLPVEKAEKLGIEKIKNPELPENPDWETTPVKVPSPWNVNSFARDNSSGGDFLTYPSYPKKWESIRAGWLMRTIPYKKEWKGKRLILRFDAIGGYTQIFINKHKIAENFEVFLPFEVDVTDEIKPGKDNEILVWVADAQLFNQPGKYGRRIYVAGSFWGQHAIGIWQDVNLIAKPVVNIQNTFVKPSLATDMLTVEATISNTSDKVREVNVSGDVSPWVNLAGKDVISAPEPKWELGTTALNFPGKKISINPHSQATVSLSIKVNGRLKEWTTEHPNLNRLILTIKDGNNEIDKQYTRFGWREFTLQGSKLCLNGNPIVLKGDSWHFMGIPQMTRRYAWAWFTLLQNSHANAVRLHAEPYPSFYLDMADEMGICVLDETGMWASDGGPKIDAPDYWKNSDEHLRRFVLRDRNHPAVFGWSVCNENMPIVLNVFHAPDSLVKRQVAEINKWIAITQRLDPTRAWISGDGETQALATMNSPVIVGHYGGSDENYRDLSSKGKPWGIGEAGMAYYATPKQSAEYNGNRSYESQQGRMEGVADEATKLINMLKKYKASYMSVFNLVWYGVKPLELGLTDTTRAPKPSDGIFFDKYREGQPGVQPERLGPYTTTLNPGYDPSLPLYKTWPLQVAVSNSFADTTIQKEEIVPAENVTVNHTAVVNNVILLSTDKDSVLYKTLSDMGVLVRTLPVKNGHNLLIIDGEHTPDGARSLALQKTISQQGGNVLIWGADPSSIKAVNKYLPFPAELTNRKATSFITTGADPLINGLGNADFYFSEISDKPIMNYGLSGELIKHSTILLDACNTDWRTWNKRAEYLKTAAVLRSEREYKPEGKALISIDAGPGKIYFFAIDPALLSATSVSLVRHMLVNLGVDFNGKANTNTAFGPDGKLHSALLLASFNVAGKSDSEISKINQLKDLKPGDYLAGKQVENHFWENATTPDGIFDLSKFHFDGPTTNAIAYLSFWIYSPHSLTNLLLEPDLPRLDMYLNADDGYQVYLNNNLIKETINAGGLTSPAQVIKALPLEKGWNHFVIKAIQKEGSWKLAVGINCDKKAFLNEIKTQVTH
ncbi:glycoside hydrolase family 2 protein [Mucilaginibacter sp. X5P1]|uniref:glycoside hydrolase family 2 protein n=1 Tax=Mucilaginibacter sp. X5P1 TaxID=2723088 RepID=UPI0016213081|nr:glycoside hydrolase family 2 TIM barrel-domain containing protein [Mucilaginibacter sp. X5P1]MBB6140357.1 beta-galactosidase [Mucilaginibacter sp. X5P1]